MFAACLPCLPAGTALAGILAVLVAGGLDMKATLAGKQLYLLYCLTPAMKPRMLMTGARGPRCCWVCALAGAGCLAGRVCACLPTCIAASVHPSLRHACCAPLHLQLMHSSIREGFAGAVPPRRGCPNYLILSETAVPPSGLPAPAGAMRAGKQRRVDTRELSLAPPCSPHPAPIPCTAVCRCCIPLRHPAFFPPSLSHLTPRWPRPQPPAAVDEEGAMVAAPVRVGTAVDTVAQAGRPKTVTGFQTHTTPVLLSVGERAELGTEKYIPGGWMGAAVLQAARLQSNTLAVRLVSCLGGCPCCIQHYITLGDAPSLC